MNPLIKSSIPTTMSTLEIAELTEKLHKNVLSDVRNMCEELEIDSAEFSAHRIDTNLSVPSEELANSKSVRHKQAKSPN